MNKAIILGAAVVGGAIGYRLISADPGRSLGSAFRRRMLQRMEHMIATLPEDAPPKLIMSVLPRLREQNDQIVALLGEQNALLRELLKEPRRP